MGREVEGGHVQPDPSVLTALSVGVLVTDGGRIVRYANPAATSLLAEPGTVLDGRALECFVDPIDAPAVLHCLKEVIDSGVPRTVRAPSASTGHDLLLQVTRDGPDRGGAMGAVVTVTDVTDVVAGTPMVEAMRSVLDHWPGIIGIVDDRANVIYLNDRARGMLDLRQDQDLSDLRTPMLFGEAAFAQYYGEIRPMLLEGRTWSGVLPVAAASGETEMWVQVSAGIGLEHTVEWVVTMSGAVEHATGPTDVAHRATHDHLTGLANRSLFLDRLQLALLRRDRGRHPVTVAFVDLNGFKYVNDSAGHSAGDEVLRLVAERIAHSVRPTDTAARWGGDEFVVLCEDVADGSQVEKRLAEGVSRWPFRVGTRSFDLTASVGTVTSPPGPSVAAELVAEADAEMYRSKNG